MRNGLPGYYGPLSWVATWEKVEEDVAFQMTEEELDRFALWFVEEFYPKVDYWRNRIGFDHIMSSGNHNVDPLRNGLVILETSPRGPFRYALQHPKSPLMRETAVVDESVPGGDTSGLVRLQWVKRLWEWSPGLSEDDLDFSSLSEAESELDLSIA